jgi:serine/threonine protein kinase
MALTYDEAIKAFHTVIFGSEEVSAKELDEMKPFVDSLAQDGIQARFPSIQMLRFLRPIEVDPVAGTIIVPAGFSAHGVRSIRGGPVGTGSFATVYKSGKIAYKVLRISGNDMTPDGIIIPGTYTDYKLNNALRIIFLESWMQTVLGSDKTFGSNIAKINRLYSMTPPSSSYKNRDIILVIEMQLLGLTAEAYIKPSEGLAEFDHIRPLCLNLTTTLEYFYATYDFVHRDLHCSNVMFHLRKVALLDFGMSCFRFFNSVGTRVIYADPDRFDPGCWSLDMFIFLSFLLEQFNKYLSETCKLQILSFFDIESSTGIRNLYTEISDRLLTPGLITYRFHGFYADKLTENPSILDLIPPEQKTVRGHLKVMREKIIASTAASVAVAAAAESLRRRGGAAAAAAAAGFPMHSTIGNAASIAKVKVKPDESTCSCKGLLDCLCWPFSGGRRRTAKTQKRKTHTRKKSRRYIKTRRS